MVMALMAMGRYSDAYDTIKFWIMNNFHASEEVKPGESTRIWNHHSKNDWLRNFRYTNQDRNENIIEMIYKNKRLDSIYNTKRLTHSAFVKFLILNRYNRNMPPTTLNIFCMCVHHHSATTAISVRLTIKGDWKLSNSINDRIK